MNSDEGISVASVDKDGLVQILESVNPITQTRRLIRQKQFSSYGAAKLYADEHDEGQRRSAKRFVV